MRLTNTLRDAFIRAVMQNVPSINYDAQVTKLVQDDIRAQLPAKIREIADDQDLRRYIHRETIWTASEFTNVVVYSDGSARLSDTAKAELNALTVKARAQSSKRDSLKSRLHACAYGVSTRKALAEMLPEFERYLPADEPAAMRSLPVVANVINEFKAAGWRAPE